MSFPNRVYYYPYLVPEVNSEKISLKTSGACQKKQRIWGNRALLEVYSRSQIIQASNLIVCWSPAAKIHKFALFDSNLEFAKYLAKVDRMSWNFYEIILGEQSQKPHFDIDISNPKKPTDEPILLDPAFSPLLTMPGFPDWPLDPKDIILQVVLESIIESIKKNFLVNLNMEHDILIYTSHNSEKRSAHLIINNYYHNNNNEAKIFYQRIIEDVPPIYRRYVDPKVYSSAQQFRIFNNTKGGSYRPKILYDNYIYQGKIYRHRFTNNVGHPFIMALQESLITFTCYCSLLPGTSEKILPILNEKSRFKSNTNYDDYGDLSDNDIVTALDMLEKYDSNNIDAFKVRSADGTLICLQRQFPSLCGICQRIHENDNPYLTIRPKTDPVTKIETLSIYYHCHRDTSGRKILLGMLTKISGEVVSAVSGASGETPGVTSGVNPELPKLNVEPGQNTLIEYPIILSGESVREAGRSDLASGSEKPLIGKSITPVENTIPIHPTEMQIAIECSSEGYSRGREEETKQINKYALHRQYLSSVPDPPKNEEKNWRKFSRADLPRNKIETKSTHENCSSTKFIPTVISIKKASGKIRKAPGKIREAPGKAPGKGSQEDSGKSSGVLLEGSPEKPEEKGKEKIL